MYVYGELKNADLHNLGADPSAGIIGRIYWNTVSLKAMLDDGTSILAFLRNDQKMILGTSGTAGNNIRMNRAAAAVLQYVIGSDTTAEGTLSTSLAQLSFKFEAYATGSLPAAGNAGRIAWDTTTVTPKVDNGAAWLNLIPVTTKGDIYGFSTVPIRLAVGTDGQYLAAASGQATGLQWTSFPVTTKGDLFIYSSTIDRLAVGTDAFVLVADSGQAAGIKWAALVNANIAAGAAIAVNKLAAVTASRALASDASGFITPSASTDIELGYLSGVTSAIQTQLGTKLPITLTTTGDMIYSSSGSTAARLPIGVTNQVLKTVGGIPTWATPAAGGVNYISANPDAEADTAGWTTYADAAQNTPVDGTGGSPSSTWTRTTSTPLRGTGSFLWTRSAANRQGEGVAFAFTIDVADKAKVLSISFDYINASGTFFAADGITAPLNDGTTSVNAGMSDLEVFIYDVTNSVLIPVSPQVLTSASATNPATFKGVFQTSSNSTSYRLIIHTARSTAVAFTQQFDNFFVGPQSVAYGPPVGDWIPYTPTISAGFGTSTNISFQYRRIGDAIDVKATFTTGTAAASLVTITLPSGLSIDSSKISVSNSSSAAGEQVGWWMESGSSLTGKFGPIVTATGTSTALVYLGGNSTFINNICIPANGSSLGDSNTFVTVSFRVPITGWSSTVQMSNDTDTRVVAAASLSTPTSAAFNDTAYIKFPTMSFDDAGSYSASTGLYTASASGKYHFSGQFGITGSSAGAFCDMNIYVNGVSTYTFNTANLVTAESFLAFNRTIKLSAGDTVGFRWSTDKASAAVSGGTNKNNLSIFRLTGPSTIAATDTIAARYETTAAQSISVSTVTIVDFGTKVSDSTNSVTTGASWKFIAPAPGRYLVSAILTFASASHTSAAEYSMSLYKNGSADGVMSTNIPAATVTAIWSLTGSSIVSLLAGDYIDVRIYQESGTRALINQARFNRVAIVRVGN